LGSQLSYTPEQEELYHGKKALVNPEFARSAKNMMHLVKEEKTG
jgi:hypothetical protein